MVTTIDTSAWGEFRVGDLFEIRPTKAHKMVNTELYDGGDNRVVANSSRNNGVAGFTSQPITEKGGVITFSDTTDAQSIFYQADDFVGYPHVQGMYPLQGGWSEGSLMFFTAVFKGVALTQGYDYSNKFTRKSAQELMVKLPITTDGNPDWSTMEQLMGEVMASAEQRLEVLSESVPASEAVDTGSWKEFVIGEIFEISSGRSPSAKLFGEGDVPYVGSAKRNNGVVAAVSSGDEVPLPGNALVLIAQGDGAAGYATYQPERFHLTSGAFVARHPAMTPEVGLFLVSVIDKNKEIYGYGFGAGRTLKSMATETVRLPATAAGEPDWDQMSAMMLQTMESAQGRLDELKEL